MTTRICVLTSQPLTNGGYRVRVAIAHNGQTRYIMSDCYIKDAKHLKNGMIVKESNAREQNMKLSALVDRIHACYDLIEGSSFFSCSELVEIIKDKLKGVKPQTILEVYDQIAIRKEMQGRSGNTMRTYSVTRSILCRFFGEKKTMQSLTEDDLLRFRKWMNEIQQQHRTNDLDKQRPSKFGYSPSTQRLILQKLKASYQFAVKNKFFLPDRNIWEDFETPPMLKRDCDLSIIDLRRLRDASFSDQYLEEVRDLLMLSFYLCGMNLVDITKQDYDKDIISYRRSKTNHSRPSEEMTEFSIQPEARKILNRFWVDGRFTFRGGVKFEAIRHALQRKLPEIASSCKIESRLIYYSMRKTFSQLCLELGVPDAVNAYCLGDTPKSSTLNYYRSSNRQLSDKYIRKVFDFVASEKTLEEAINEIL